MNKVEPFWTISDKFRQLCKIEKNVDKIRPILTSLDHFEQFQTSLNKFEQVWISLDRFGQVWKKSRPIWTSQNQFKTNLNISLKFQQFHTCFDKSRIFLIIKSRQVQTKWKESKTYLASKANAKTPAASGAAAEVPEWVLVHFPYRSVVA